MDKGKVKKVTKKITVWGIVQGVGFRPFVFRLAQKHSILGTVRNMGGLVEIIAQSSKDNFDDFLHELKTSSENEHEIINIECEDINYKEFKDFKIIRSGDNNEISVIPPDLPVCSKCQQELYNNKDRRFLNPFISCMSCGPRYTIIEELPYDRDNTTMVDFKMCKLCNEEYTSSKSRRFHAQTISCNDCGPYLIFKSDQEELLNEKAFDVAVKIINTGGIVAVKGIGGYHLVCSPFIEDSVQNLRKLKGREEKPFAVMFESTESILKHCFVSEKEKELLESKAKPIVLLYNKNDKLAKSVNKGSVYCGAFLPYTPLQHMLIKKCGPLIMTSANISNKPIIKDDNEILLLKSPYLEGVLYNKRKIVRSVDDSVTKIIDDNPQMIRRSRGYVPYPIFLSKQKNLQIFAAGGDLKAAFCLYKDGNAVVSQYFGDLEETDVLNEYKKSVNDLSKLLKINADIAVCDMHPNYHSSKFAKELRLPIVYVQHHHAHIASVMAEHNLNESVIGVAFDGTGYGTDDNIWGGEFLICEGAEFNRAAHLSYTPIIGGDSSMKDAQKTATCFLLNSKLDEFVEDKRADTIRAAVDNNINSVLTSSMGRLFDAVSAILGIQNENRYEGECAALLEKEAIIALNNKVEPQKLSFAFEKKVEIIEISSRLILEDICKLKLKVKRDALALGFHFAVADLILQVCKVIRSEQKINKVALSGGVFQNSVLMNRSLKLLRENNFDVYYNKAVPPNDGSISLGQTYIGLMR